MQDEQPEARKLTANPGYALFQLAKALTTAEQHQDPQVRERAEAKLSKWIVVFNAILDGSVQYGSRTPFDGIPEWVTLEVVTGGFATGAHVAGGPLLAHEREILDQIAPSAESEARQAINRYFLTDEGLARLRSLLASRCYDVGVPEEGALLVVAWLVQRGDSEAARRLLEELAPFFSKLRFYPVPLERPRTCGAEVCLQSVGETLESLQRIAPNRRVLAQSESIRVWAPLYDRMVALFLETVEGEPPSLLNGTDGGASRAAGGKHVVAGGWPCRTYPADWRARVVELLAEIEAARKRHRLCGKPDRAKDGFARLRELLRRCIEAPDALTGGDVGRLRLILARSIYKRGTPDSPRCREHRARQAAQAAGPTHYQLAQVLASRLGAYARDDGLDDLAPVTRALSPEEARQCDAEPGLAIPSSLQRKAQRALKDTVAALVERGVVTSGETLARVLPQITSGLRATSMSDPALRHLYAAIYRAFRRRRSLLLLNLEGQVALEALPWIAAIERFRSADLSARELARQTLEEVAVLTISSFPHAIVPNKLLQELRTLAEEAQVDLPLVDELAADIFMGEFSPKFRDAAKQAGDFVQGTIYERYYGIDSSAIRGMGRKRTVRRSWLRQTVVDPFVELCSSRAGVTYGSWDPAINGMIIEQGQILTTHNLAALFSGLDLADALGDRLAGLPERCFAWVCRRLQVRTEEPHARLIALKNAAYAWRQMIFYLALLPPDGLRRFLTWADRHLQEQGDGFRERFLPAFRGLAMAADGRVLDERSASAHGARRFLGWSKGVHWLLA